MGTDMNTKTLGFIGLGVMGSAMAGHLKASGERLIVYTRTKAKAQLLLDAGAEWSDSVAQLAQRCDVIFTMVGYPSDVEEVYFGPEGLLAHARQGTILVDMTTSRPDLAIRIHEAGRQKGIRTLDAPVSGGDIGARNGTLSIMVGGDEATFEEVKPLFAMMGKTIVLQGGPGAGQHAKMANQIAVAANLIGAVESVTYARRAGLNPTTVLQSITTGAAGSWQLANMVPRMLEGNFAPGFFIKHFLKDLRIALDAAREMKLDLPLLELAERLFEQLTAEGMENLGTHALYMLYDRGLVQSLTSRG